MARHRWVSFLLIIFFCFVLEKTFEFLVISLKVNVVVIYIKLANHGVLLNTFQFFYIIFPPYYLLCNWNVTVRTYTQQISISTPEYVAWHLNTPKVGGECVQKYIEDCNGTICSAVWASLYCVFKRKTVEEKKDVNSAS
jgi:hypothetical protein